jgi:hypothetical protein
MKNKHALCTFIGKYMFVLKAAADGWRIKYIGADQFEFITTRFAPTDSFGDVKSFVDYYNNSLKLTY